MLLTGVPVLLLLTSVYGATVYGPLCGVCEGDHSLAECKSFHRCKRGEKCFLQTFEEIDHHNIKRLRYYGGCTDGNTCHNRRYFPNQHKRSVLDGDNESPHSIRGTVKCAECCEGDECNLHLCGSKSSVVFCAVCNGESSVTHCRHFAVCPSQECYLQVYSRPHFFFFRTDHRIYGGCATAKTCSSRQNRDGDTFNHNEELTDHHSSGTLWCEACCHDDSICNVELCGQKEYFQLPAHSTLQTTPSTTSMTTEEVHSIIPTSNEVITEPVKVLSTTTKTITTTATSMKTTRKAIPTSTTMYPIHSTTQWKSSFPSTMEHLEVKSNTPPPTATTAEREITTPHKALNSHVKYCAVCDGTSAIDQCVEFKYCPGQDCYLQSFNQSGDVLIYGGCASRGQCADLPNLNSHLVSITKGDKIPMVCADCCNEDSMCNLGLCDSKSVVDFELHV